MANFDVVVIGAGMNRLQREERPEAIDICVVQVSVALQLLASI
jgi:hypothetical protein